MILIFLTRIFLFWHIESNLLATSSRWCPRSFSLCTLESSYKSVASCDGSGRRSRCPHCMSCHGL